MRALPPWSRPFLAAFLCGLAVLAFDSLVPTFSSPIRRLQYDLLFRHVRSDEPVDERIVVFLVDDTSLAGIGAYPIPRSMHAELMRGLRTARVGAVAWDFIFDIPGAGDPAFAAAMRKVPAVLALGAARLDPRAPPETDEALEAVRRFSVGSPLDMETWPAPEMRLTIQSIRRFLDAAAGAGHVATTVDEDGICRRVPLVIFAGGRILPSLGLAAAMSLLGVPSDDLAFDAGAVVIGEKTLKERAVRVPVDPEGNLLVSLAGDWFERIDHRSYFSQLESLREAPELMAEGLEGKLVVVGYSASAGGDFVAVPGGGHVPGVMVTVAIANTILTGRSLSEASAFPVAAATLLLPLLLAMFHARQRPVLAAAAAVLVILGLPVISAQFFALKGVFIPVAAPLAACALSAGLLAMLAHAREYARATRTSEILSRFVSPALLDELQARGSQRSLPAPRRVELAVLFVDIAGFTPFTEEQEPEVVSELLAGFYPMAMEELSRHSGTLDAFQGDGVLAYFGAPQPLIDKELQSVRAAAAIRNRFAEMDTERVRRGGQPLGIRCGIATGFAAVGYFGGGRRATYGVVGRAVNLASRIQGQGGPGEILLDRLTAKRVEDRVRLSALEPLKLKGIAKPVELWRVESEFGD